MHYRDAISYNENVYLYLIVIKTKRLNDEIHIGLPTVIEFRPKHICFPKRDNDIIHYLYGIIFLKLRFIQMQLTSF